MASSLALLPLLPLLTTAYMHDTVLTVPMIPPTQCLYGCALWSDLAASHSTASQASVDRLWLNRTLQAAALRSCAIPGALSVPQGASCYCAGTPSAPTSAWGVCAPPAAPTPMQINLQFGASGAQLQVAFVTEDRGAPLLAPPLVELCGGGVAGCVNATGLAWRAPEPQQPSRVLTYAFVPLPEGLTRAGGGRSPTARCRGRRAGCGRKCSSLRRRRARRGGSRCLGTRACTPTPAWATWWMRQQLEILIM